MLECANVLMCEPLLFQVAYLDDTDIILMVSQRFSTICIKTVFILYRCLGSNMLIEAPLSVTLLLLLLLLLLWVELYT